MKSYFEGRVPESHLDAFAAMYAAFCRKFGLSGSSAFEDGVAAMSFPSLDDAECDVFRTRIANFLDARDLPEIFIHEGELDDGTKLRELVFFDGFEKLGEDDDLAARKNEKEKECLEKIAAREAPAMS